MFQKDYWENRWQSSQTGWDLGQASTPLVAYFDQLTNFESQILIPGCGNAWEGEYLHKMGFKNVFLLDVAPTALKKFQKRVPTFPASHLLNNDFFQLQGAYDLIIEQTFFCAIDPSLRSAYAGKAASLLKPGGKIVGLLFENDFGKETPPFGGNRAEYLNYFEPLFKIKICDLAYNSIAPRSGNELFILFEKRINL